MAFWLDPLWFGRPASSGGTRIPALDGINLGVPVQTRLIEVLRAEISDVEVWPDADQSEGGDSIVVMSTGGDSLRTSNNWVQMHRTFHIAVTSDTSDGAERLLDEVVIVIKRRRDAFNFSSLQFVGGTFDKETETYQRAVDVTFRGRK